MRYQTVIFDLDGTLLDTLDDLADAVNAVLAARGFPRRSREEVREFVGNGVGMLVRRSLPAGADEDTVLRCLADFKAYYAAHMEVKTAPYAGVTALLERLRADGCRLGVVSNKFDGAVQTLCTRYFGDRLDACAGEGEGRARKPAPDGVWYVMDTLGGTAEDTVYIGDSEVDAETARRAGIPCIGVCWGFRSADTLRAAGMTVVVDSADALYEAIAHGGTAV